MAEELAACREKLADSEVQFRGLEDILVVTQAGAEARQAELVVKVREAEAELVRVQKLSEHRTAVGQQSPDSPREAQPVKAEQEALRARKASMKPPP